ncbi:putative LRR receptor-like serine/threonine-protein kinase [Vitis vinifera]|uniref:Putative LRR receptor-like serine/threonine-protein kinase n=1 Tax=Vitis vinifera TaxID=29760 RepID=A0A438BRL4_VITVI|nr:putative LRR receptor-like serine/threonine-protein kinase [Vitis vinifera]
MCSYLLDLKHLQYLDLSCNDFGSLNIPEFFGSLSTLRYLNLSSAEKILLNAKDIEWISGLTFLKFLDMTNVNLSKASNWLQHPVTFMVNSMRPGKGLELLRLRGNKLLGHLPSELGQLKSLSYLSIDGNLFSGQIPISLGRIPSSSYLNIRENFFNQRQLQLDSSFSTHKIDLASCLLGPQFPAWLQTKKYLESLSLPYAGISSVIPAWFWTGSYLSVDLSHNQIIGNIPSLHSFDIYLGSNNFTGPLPQISSDVAKLDPSNNLFCESLSPMLCRRTDKERELTMLKLGNNNLTGHIPSSMGYLIWLGSLHLLNNRFSGHFPLPLKNCSSLVVLDLSEKEFTGSIPAWMGNFKAKFIDMVPGDAEITYTPGLMVLILHSNKFNGNAWQFQQHDQTKKNSSSPFPFHNEHDIMRANRLSNTGYERSRVRVQKNSWPPSWHRPLKHKLSGEIPEELTRLHGLMFLNLSNNHLQRKIPVKIGP